MSGTLPTRPNLDHLREQAKDLLSRFRTGKPEAQSEFQQYLPALAELANDAVGTQKLTLTDAQSVIARKHGFVSWPKLVKHVDTLKSLEGTWRFISLEVEGNAFPEGAFRSSYFVFDGDAFTMVSPEATYAGRFAIDANVQPNTLDIHFLEGPEAGNDSFGIFEFDDRELRICLGLTGASRPTEFKSGPGTGHALEVLRRGSPTEQKQAASCSEESADPADIGEFGEMTPELEAIQGEWSALSITRDGMVLPMHHFGTGKRTVKGAELAVTFGGQPFMNALVRVDASQSPIAVDYLLTQGPHKGRQQFGIMEWDNGLHRVCFAEPGKPRPTELAAPAGSGCTLSVWRRVE